MRNQVTTNPPRDLAELVWWFRPEALDLEYLRLADDVYDVHILDLDYTYTRWLACLGLDGRWTLSPRT